MLFRSMRKDFLNGAEWMEWYIETKPLALGHQYGTLGDYYLASKDIPNAVKALETGIRIDPYTFWAHYRLAQLLEEQKDHEKAVEQYKIALRYGYDRDPAIYTHLAELYRAQGRVADAASVLRTGLRIFPTNSELYRLYGEIGGGD